MNNKPATAPSDMTAWSMSLSVFHGLKQTEAKAREEYNQIIADNPNKPFAPGLGLANDLLNTVSKAKLNLEHELRRMARSSGLSMPADDKDTK